MFNGVQLMLADGADASFGLEVKTAIAAFIVGTVVGMTGMGGGALMTPALIFLGVGDASAVVTADLTAAAVYKSAGATVHWRKGKPNFHLAKWLILGSVPMALLGPHLVRWMNSGEDSESLDTTLKLWIGFALLLAATTYALRLYIELRRRAKGTIVTNDDPVVRPFLTVLVGAVGGLLVGITSVGSGSVIMIALLMLYPGLSAPQARRHRPRAGGAVGHRRRDLEHRAQRPRLEHRDPADHRLGSRLDPGLAHRAAGSPVVHPARDRRRADDVGPGAARQGRMVAAWIWRRRHSPGVHRDRRTGRPRCRPARVGVPAQAARHAHVRGADRGRDREPRRRGHG